LLSEGADIEAQDEVTGRLTPIARMLSERMLPERISMLPAFMPLEW